MTARRIASRSRSASGGRDDAAAGRGADRGLRRAGGDARGLERLFRTLTERIAFLTQGGEAPTLDPKYPPPDSGLLGPIIVPDNLTVTVAVGASLFDDRFGLRGQAAAPRRHAAVPQRRARRAIAATATSLLQFCANTAETNIHALRDILKNTPDLLALRWKIDGFLPPHTVRKLGKETVRNLLGFKDGTANLDASDGALMDDIVWVQPGAGEPAWTQAAPIRWCASSACSSSAGTARAGRAGDDHRPRKGERRAARPARERDEPDYAADPEGKRIPLNAHIRLANPRTAETEASRILRRGYNYSRGADRAPGSSTWGCCSSASRPISRPASSPCRTRLNGEPLEEYIKPIGGGYFFVLPGVRSKDDFFAEGLLRAAA